MYFINKKIVKSIANEIYRDAGYTEITENENYYVVYDSENTSKATDYTVAFTVTKDMENEVYDFKHFIICFIEDKGAESHRTYYTTNTLNRRELADKLLDIISSYEYLQEVSA